MLVKDILANENFELANNVGVDREVKGMYTCDLLSHAMAKAKEDNVFITVHNNLNSLAVASLLDLGCVIIPDNIRVDEEFIQRADREDVAVLLTKLNAVQIILKLDELGLK
jgi:serine kinase of HPr protein (carbohydrate metabolism regulator)